MGKGNHKALWKDFCIIYIIVQIHMNRLATINQLIAVSLCPIWKKDCITVSQLKVTNILIRNVVKIRPEFVSHEMGTLQAKLESDVSFLAFLIYRYPLYFITIFLKTAIYTIQQQFYLCWLPSVSIQLMHVLQNLIDVFYFQEEL